MIRSIPPDERADRSGPLAAAWTRFGSGGPIDVFKFRTADAGGMAGRTVTEHGTRSWHR